MPEFDLSVIVPCYKQANFLPDAIASVLGNSGVRTELIVVDDGPDDEVVAACKPFGDAVRIVRQQNAGLSAARNRGVAESCGPVLHFLNLFFGRQLPSESIS